MIARIPQKELDKLRAKARAHDVYLRAARIMRAVRHSNAASASVAFREGYYRALRDFDQAIVDADREEEGQDDPRRLTWAILRMGSRR